MNPAQSPFPTGWWAFDLGDYRPSHGTYSYYPYESIPPLDETLFRGEFQWLAELEPGLKETLSLYSRPEAQATLPANLECLAAEAKQLQLKLPDSFLRFMQRPDWQEQLPSCTACYFSLSEHIIQLPIDAGGYLIRFLNDQQDVLLWYLYLTRTGEYCVVVSPIFFDAEALSEIPLGTIRQNTFFCAPTFEAFVYRFWLENKIWFALNDAGKTTPVQKNYLAHYMK